MSEIKPWGYIHKSATQTLRDRALCNSTITKKSTANSDMQLYTEAELAKAVAEEREKLTSGIVERIDLYRVTGNPSDMMQDESCKAIVEAIQRAVK